MKKVFLKNLGCPKNEVDGNILLSILEKHNLQSTHNPRQADIIIINSCGFIEEAKQESIEEVLALAAIKGKRPVKLVLAGCLAQRYKEILEQELPEVDLVVGIGNLALAGKLILGGAHSLKRTPTLPIKYREYDEVQKATGKPYAYLKICDGCDNFCSYCAIPHIRGRFRSRRLSHILQEAQIMAGRGTRELILVGQDITQYGLDLYGRRSLAGLLKKLEQVQDIKWIRLLYTHPAHYDDGLLDYLINSSKVLPYLDLPLQHISDRLLTSMNRRVNAGTLKKLIEKLRYKIDKLVLRTTYIIGFPGENDMDFQALLDFQDEYKIERVGVFPYSREEGTPAVGLLSAVPDKIINERMDSLMTLVMDQSLERNQALLGKKIEVIIDEKSKDDYYIARSYDQAPEIDGFIRAFGRFRPGGFYNVVISDFEAYDLEARSGKE